ncbi:MAG: RND family transporter [Parvularculaceae bacterium]
MAKLASSRASALACILICIICVAGAHRLTINADTRTMFAKADENRLALNAFEARYASSVNLLIALHAADGDVFTPARLKAIRQLTEEAWTLPYSTRIDSVSNAPHISSDADGVVVAEMFDATPALSDEASSADAVRERVMADELLVERLIAADGRTAAVNVVVDYPMNSPVAVGEILAAARSLPALDAARAAGLEPWFGGRVASGHAFAEASKRDLKTLTPLSFVVLFALLVFLLRSAAHAGALFGVAALAAASAMGLGGWLGVQITAGSAYAPTIIIALGVASLSHLVITARGLAANGAPREAAVRRAVAIDAAPVALTLATTAIGFMTLNFAESPPFREVGRLIALGACFCLLYGLVLLPALLIRLPMGDARPHPFIRRAVEIAADVAVRRRRALMVAAPILVLAAAGGVATVAIDDRFPHYFDDRFEFRRHADLIEERLTGLEVVEFDVGGATDGAIYDPDYQSALADFETWLKDQPHIVYVSSVRDVLKRLNRHMNGGAPDEARVPDEPDLLAQYMLLYELSSPLGQDLTHTVTIDKARTRVTTILRDATTRDVRMLRERAEAWFDARVADVDGAERYDAVGTGLAVMFAYLSSINIKAMIGGTAAGAALISLILCFAFRSARYGAISLVPNFLPAAVAFGVWGYLMGEIGVAVSTVAALSLGIIVDDTIHLIWRYREARQRGLDPEASARAMFAAVGEPMLISTIALVAGFLVLAASGFRITNSTGLLTAGTVGAALALDWFLLAPLLITIDKALAATPAKADAVDAAPASALS